MEKNGNPDSQNHVNLMLAQKKLYKKDAVTTPDMAQLWRILQSANKRKC